MRILISDIPEGKTFSDYPEGTEFVFEEAFPRYILEPYERIYPNDPRYESALTREEVEEMLAKGLI